MHGRARKILAALTVAMVAVFLVGVLAAAQVINLPGNLRETLGFEKATPNPPCHLHMYRRDPKSPPPEPGHWRSEPEMPRTQVEATAVAIGPVVYTAEGSPPGNLHTVLAFDTRTKTWSEPTHIPIGLDHAEAATYNGKLYLAGGYLDGEEPTTDFWQYDPKTNRWTQLPSMHQPPRAAGAAAVIGHRLYVAGGAPQTFNVSSFPVYNTLEIYDFDTGKWSFGAPMQVGRHHISGAAVDGKLYVVGGRGEKDHSLTIFESYDPKADEWKTLPPIPLGVASPRVVAADGKVVVVGGEDQLNWEEGDGWVTPSAWAFDPKLNRWARLPDMRFERRGGGAGFAGGRVYAIGGSYCPGLKPGGPVGTHTVESLSIGAIDRAFEND
jgi:N-acetylneuraminic acid mutarotase